MTSLVNRGVGGLMLVAVLLFSGAVKASSEAVNATVNPHGDPERCEVCHLLPKEKLGGFFTSSASKRQLRADHVLLCRQCHGMGFGHGVGMKPEMNHEGLPLAGNGTITCATTCHSMHVKDPADLAQEHYHLRLPLSKICFSCHEK